MRWVDGRKEGAHTRAHGSEQRHKDLALLPLWFATGSAPSSAADRHTLVPETQTQVPLAGGAGGLGRVDEAVLVHFFHACPRARSLATPFSEQKRGGVWRAVWCGGVRRGKKGRGGAGMERSRVRMRRGQGAEEGRARRWQ